MVDTIAETVFTRGMEATTTRKAIILEGADDIDPLESVDSVKLTSRQLKPGMVLVDTELGCPAAMLDHSNGSIGHGCVEWMIHDLDTGALSFTAFPVSRIPTVSVAVR